MKHIARKLTSDHGRKTSLFIPEKELACAVIEVAIDDFRQCLKEKQDRKDGYKKLTDRPIDFKNFFEHSFWMEIAGLSGVDLYNKVLCEELGINRKNKKQKIKHKNQK